jgi:hypothetical protein
MSSWLVSRRAVLDPVHSCGSVRRKALPAKDRRFWRPEPGELRAVAAAPVGHAAESASPPPRAPREGPPSEAKARQGRPKPVSAAPPARVEAGAGRQAPAQEQRARPERGNSPAARVQARWPVVRRLHALLARRPHAPAAAGPTRWHAGEPGVHPPRAHGTRSCHWGSRVCAAMLAARGREPQTRQVAAFRPHASALRPRAYRPCVAWSPPPRSWYAHG